MVGEGGFIYLTPLIPLSPIVSGWSRERGRKEKGGCAPLLRLLPIWVMGIITG